MKEWIEFPHWCQKKFLLFWKSIFIGEKWKNVKSNVSTACPRNEVHSNSVCGFEVLFFTGLAVCFSWNWNMFWVRIWSSWTLLKYQAIIQIWSNVLRDGAKATQWSDMIFLTVILT